MQEEGRREKEKGSLSQLCLRHRRHILSLRPESLPSPPPPSSSSPFSHGSPGPAFYAPLSPPPPQEATFPSFLFSRGGRTHGPPPPPPLCAMTLGLLLLTGKDKLRASLSRSFRVLGGGWRRRDRARRSLIIPHLRTVFSSPSRSLNTYLADLRTSFFHFDAFAATCFPSSETNLALTWAHTKWHLYGSGRVGTLAFIGGGAVTRKP